MTTLYSQQEIRVLEKLAIAHGINGQELMNRAGHAAFMLLQDIYPEAKAILVLCGGGNNGGDGYVLARLAHKAGLEVFVRAVGDVKKLKDEALLAYKACKDAGLAVKPWDFDEAMAVDLVVDALIGIGIKGKLKPEVQEVIEAINDTDVPVLAIDVPSGLMADTGDIAGTAMSAEHTITFLGMKRGMLTGMGPEFTGLLFCHDLNLPPDLFEQIGHSAVAVNAEVFQGCLGGRPRFSNKKHMGHVLVVGGGPGMSGAAKLAALGAARIGAGLISVATHPEHAALLNLDQPELMCHGVKSVTQLKPLLEKATVVAIGPGLGQSDWAKRLLKAVLASKLPVVVDADALNILSASKKIEKRKNWVLTPHPGEAARMLACTHNKIQKDRFAALRSLQKKFGGTVVLKGCGTLIASNLEPLLCHAGNPGMASGGMGDLLTGIIAGLIAQGVELPFAAALGTGNRSFSRCLL
jgi:NAD(P)H-hydrate epimerase